MGPALDGYAVGCGCERDVVSVAVFDALPWFVVYALTRIEVIASRGIIH